MRIIHLDAVGGIAGDMFVGAMLDALPNLVERVTSDAMAVLRASAGSVRIEEGSSGGVRALRFKLHEAKTNARRVTEHHSSLPPDHRHDDHVHHEPLAEHEYCSKSYARLPAHGSFSDLVARIEEAPLSKGTARHAVAILAILAEAEATIHSMALADVHFHEIADWDSLADVVASGSIAAALEGARWSVSELPRGGGLVHTQHGLLPVPSPATAAILTGFRFRDDGISGERVTPTGAAILRHLVSTDNALASARLVAVGAGAGTRDLPGLPNVLRALVFETDDAAGAVDRIAVISLDIDDMTGEEMAVAADRLRAASGVVDVSICQLIGKKGRPLHSFRLLVMPESLDQICELCSQETSTIGLRWRMDERVVLPRQHRTVLVDGQSVRVKTVTRSDGSATVKAESDDLVGARSLAERRTKKAAAEREIVP